MKAYKGFNKDMTCRDFQYEEGKIYVTDGAKLCEKGFHACEDPLDCWDYYDLLGSEFHEVEIDDVSDERNGDSKIVVKKITIGAKLDICEMVKASVDYVRKSVKGCVNRTDDTVVASGKHLAKIASVGNWVRIASGGDLSHICSNGRDVTIASSGHFAKIGSSGDYAQICSSGDCVLIGSGGNMAQICSSGELSHIDMSGKRSVAASVGDGGMIRAKVGDWIVLSEWRYVNAKYTPVCVKAGKVDGITLKPDIWYKLKDGEFVEVEE